MTRPGPPRPLTVALLLAFSLTCLHALWRSAASGRELADAVVRLHIVAASDSESDQQNKLLVRDRVLELMRGEMLHCADRDEALTRLSLRLAELETAAEETLQQAGNSAPVTAELGDRHFPLRQYGRLTAPAGRYLALTLTIGEGEGQNWWCVMYPPLCYGEENTAVEEAAVDRLSTLLSDRTARQLIGEEETEYRFRLLEGLKAFLADRKS